MHHVATITKTSNKHLPFHAQCSCGPAGDFSAKESAEAYLRSHLAHLGGITTQEFVDDSEKEVVEKPVMPLTHAASVPIPAVEEPTPFGAETIPAEQLHDDRAATGGEVVDPATQIPSESEANWPKKKKK